MQTPVPDLAGFAAAQKSLRTFFGRDVRFYGPAAIIYDPALPPSMFDEEGFPVDPTITGSATASADVGITGLTYLGSAHCNVVFQPLSAMRRDEVQRDETDIRSKLNKDLILDLSDKPLASGATYFQVGTATRDVGGAEVSWEPDEPGLWKIANAKDDGLGGHQRYIVFGQDTR